MTRRVVPLPTLLLLVVAAALPSLRLPGQSPTPDRRPAARLRLVYELPVDALQRSLRGQADSDLEQVLARAVQSVVARLPEDVAVARSGAVGFTVDLPDADPARLAETRRLVEATGKLEMRLVADAEYRDGPFAFDLPAEKRRLEAWLQAGGAARLQADVRALDAFHADAKAGPVDGTNLRWFVRRIVPSEPATDRWTHRLAEIPSLQPAVVAVYSDRDWNDGAVPPHIQQLPAAQRVLLELVAVNLHEVHFANADFDPASITATADAAGEPALDYTVLAARAADYGNWSEKHVGRCFAILWNDVVQSTPRFMSRIPGRGRLAGNFTPAEVDAMARMLRTRPLPVLPELKATLPLAPPAPAGDGKK